MLKSSYLVVIGKGLFCLLILYSCSGLKQNGDSLKSINVSQFGAIADDNVDDTKGIQEALDFAARRSIAKVILGVGTYDISRANVPGQAYCLTMPSFVSLVGDTTSVSTLKLASGQRNYTRMLYVDGVSNVNVVNVTFDGNRAKQSQDPRWEHLHGVFINEAEDISINNCHFNSTRGDGIGIRGPLTTSKNIVVENCSFRGNGRNGITLGSGFDGVTIDKCIFYSSTIFASPIDSEPERGVCKNVSITNCKIFNKGNSATLVTFGGHVKVTGYTFRNNEVENSQLLFFKAYNAIIESNSLICTDSAFAVVKVICDNSKIAIRNNSIEAHTKVVESYSTNYCVASGLDFYENDVVMTGAGSEQAIIIKGSKNISIRNNKFRANKGYQSAAIYMRTTADIDQVRIVDNEFYDFPSYIEVQGYKTYSFKDVLIDNLLIGDTKSTPKYRGKKDLLRAYIPESTIRSKAKNNSDE